MDKRVDRRREQNRVLVAGLALSVAVHAVILTGTFSLPVPVDRDGDGLEAMPEGIEVVTLREVPDTPEQAETPRQEPEQTLAGGGNDGGPAAAQRLVAIAPESAPSSPQFAEGAVADSWSAFLAVAPELAETGEVEADEDEEQKIYVAVYSRGSVGAAKAQWASNGGFGASQSGRGFGVTIGGARGGACPTTGGLPGILRR